MRSSRAELSRGALGAQPAAHGCFVRRAPFFAAVTLFARACQRHDLVLRAARGPRAGPTLDEGFVTTGRADK